MPVYVQSLLKRITALGDKSALLLIVPAVAALYEIDSPLCKTVLEWLLVTPIFAGVAIILSRTIFPQVDLGLLVDEAVLENKAAAIIVAGLMVFCGLLIMALTLWARA